MKLKPWFAKGVMTSIRKGTSSVENSAELQALSLCFKTF